MASGIWEERFRSKVNYSDKCWEWTGTRYGCFFRSGKKLYAHRVSYEMSVGPIPAGMQIDHLCRNRICVNPSHLEVVTGAVNLQRQAAHKTHCPHGHAYDEANTYRHPRRGERRCRRCRADGMRRWKDSGRATGKRKERLDDAVVQAIRASSGPAASAAREFGVSRSTVYMIRHNRLHPAGEI